MSNELDAFENQVKKNYNGIGEDFPKGSIKILSPDILNILITNARKAKNVDYKSEEIIYNVTFSSYTKLDADGMVGTYVDLPDDLNIRETKFIVTGFHPRWDTEITFSKDYMTVMPDRELKHLINFQRAIITTGILKI
ncbi:hypothetical protein [Ferroplasma sp.]|uniref:hypothetical protein n=1 Tax=Ferroplasma sp. TaxID=2591003 RepID=UPI00307EA146